MNKDEILEKSRKEKADEGMDAAENKGSKAGLLVLCVMYAFIEVVTLFVGKGNQLAAFAATAMFWGAFAVYSYPKYKFTGKKAYLVTTVAGSIASVCSLISIVVELVK